jgi:two-component system, NarL family, response regulator LiaR
MMSQVVRSPPLSISLLIVDQHLAFRDALAARLQAEPDFAVGGKAHSADFALRVLIGRPTDVVLLEAELPDDSAIAFCTELTRRAGAPRVVMLSAASKPERIVAAVRAGASAWVRKDESVDHLLRVIHSVIRGETWLPPMELGPVLRLLIEAQDNQRDCDELLASLTPREQDVLFHLVEGANRKEVAERLQVSTNTVRTHLHSLMAKLGAHSTLEVVALTRTRLGALPGIREPHGLSARLAQHGSSGLGRSSSSILRVTATASSALCTPSFVMRFCRCVRTVLGDMCRCSATSCRILPSARHIRTSRSRSVSAASTWSLPSSSSGLRIRSCNTSPVWS